MTFKTEFTIIVESRNTKGDSGGELILTLALQTVSPFTHLKDSEEQAEQ